MLACSWYAPVFVKSLQSPATRRFRARPTNRCESSGALWPSPRAAASVRDPDFPVGGRQALRRGGPDGLPDDILYASIAALLDTLTRVTAQIAVPDKAVSQIVVKDEGLLAFDLGTRRRSDHGAHLPARRKARPSTTGLQRGSDPRVGRLSA